MNGTAKEPKFKVKVLGTDGQSTVRQSTEAAVQRESRELVGKAEQAAGKALDSIRQRAAGEAEKQAAELERKAREALEKQIGGKLPDTLVKQAEKVLNPSKAREEAEKLKKELEQFNPFKKKVAPRDTTKNG
jgi:chemotaxis regulatin CheY-phosphate phosphatase CheZ